MIKQILDGLERLREEINRLRVAIESKESLIPRFVESSPQVRTYVDMIRGVIQPYYGTELGTDLYIMDTLIK